MNKLLQSRNAAFEEWRQKLNHGDRLPRGRYFVGKKAGRKRLIIDEYWSSMADRGFNFTAEIQNSCITPEELEKHMMTFGSFVNN